MFSDWALVHSDLTQLFSDLAQVACVAGITDKIVTFFCLLDKKRAEKFPVAEIGGKDTIGGTGWE